VAAADDLQATTVGGGAGDGPGQGAAAEAGAPLLTLEEAVPPVSSAEPEGWASNSLLRCIVHLVAVGLDWDPLSATLVLLPDRRCVSSTEGGDTAPAQAGGSVPATRAAQAIPGVEAPALRRHRADQVSEPDPALVPGHRAALTAHLGAVGRRR
jgi:hypothetical protein